MSTIVLSQFVVRSASGSVDEEATVSKFRHAVAQFVADRETEETRIAEEIEKVLSANTGTRTNLDFVTGEVARALNATALNYTAFKEKVAEYIRANACGEKDGKPIDNKTNAELPEPRRYFMGKGREGGVARWTDRLAAQADKAAKKAAAAKK